MIDWFTGILPCTHRPLPAGSVVSVDADGAVEWETVKRLTVRGSHESTMKVRSVGSDGEGRATHLYIDGNPSKFLQGHSVIGSDDLQGLVLTAYARILALLHIPHDLPSYRQVMEGQFKISRIDINYMYSLSTLENVRAWLYAAEFKAKTRHGRACGKGGTVYLGKNSRRWSLKFYSKYDEHTSGKKGHQMADEFVKAGLLDWSKDKLRIELTLRTTELIDLNLTLGNSWNIETPNKLFSDYVGRIEMNLYEFLENRDYEEIESYITDCISHNKNNELDEYRKLVLVLMLSEFFERKDFKHFYNNHQFDINEGLLLT